MDEEPFEWVRDFFVRELCTFSNCWERNEAEIRRVAAGDAHSFTMWLYGYEKYGREDYEKEADLAGKLRERNLCLSFLAEELLESDVESPAVSVNDS